MRKPQRETRPRSIGRECYERLQKAADAILNVPTRAMQKRELAKYCEGKSAAACAEMRGWLDHKSRGD